MTELHPTLPVPEIPEAAPYVSRCVVCGKPGTEHPTGRWCGSEQYVTGDWSDDPAVNDVARAIEAAFGANDADSFEPEARAAISAYRRHLTAEQDAETKRLTLLISDLVFAAVGRYAFGESPESQVAPAIKAINAMCADDAERDAEIEQLRAGYASCEYLLPLGHEDAQTCDQPCHPSTDRCPQHDQRHLDYIAGLRSEIASLKDAHEGRDVNDRERDAETAALRAELAAVDHDLVYRLAAADQAWSDEFGDEVSSPDYIRHLAEHAIALRRPAPSAPEEQQ